MNSAHNGHGDLHADNAHAGETADEHHDAPEGDLNKTIATVVVVAAGAAIFEAALLPGLVLGVAAMAAPKYLPRVAAALGPVFKSTVRGTYKLAQKSKEAFAEASEQVNDIVAEVKAESDAHVAEAPHAHSAHSAN